MNQTMSKLKSAVAAAPDIYTILLIVALVCMVVTVSFGLWNLMSADGYNLTFGQLFGPFVEIIGK